MPRTAAKATATIVTAIEAWLAQVGDRLSPTTLRGYRAILRSRIAPSPIGTMPLTRLSTLMLDRYYTGLSAQGIAPASVRQTHAVIRRALKQATKHGVIATNPAVDCDLPAARKPVLRPPTPTEVAKLVAACEDDEDFATYLRLAAAVGMRRGEGAALRWSRVDLDAGLVTIDSSVVPVGADLLLRGTKTHAVRTVPVGSATVVVLTDHRARAEVVAAPFGGLAPDAFVFSFEPDYSRPWHPDTITHRFGLLRAKVGLEGVRLHDLRHFTATQMLSAGYDPVTVASLLGHASPTMTLNVYGHAVTAQQRAAGDHMDTVLG